MFCGGDYDEAVDVFSFGIVCAEFIARLYADPDVLPRTARLVNGDFCFGLDYEKFERLYGEDCPRDLLELTFDCCNIDPDQRPDFSGVVEILEPLAIAPSES